MTKAAFAGVLAGALALAGCDGPDQSDITGSPPAGPSAAERAYRAPPAVTGAARLAGGRVALTGTAIAGARVRLASPAGQAVHATAGDDGRWRLVLGPAAGTRLFGLSMEQEGRGAQSEGYLAVTPDGAAAQLRAGSGAAPVGVEGTGLRILAVDFDAGGVTVVTGTAPAAAVVTVRVDGLDRGQVGAARSGRFSFAIDEPLAAGPHRLEVACARRTAAADVDILAPAAFSGPFAAARIAGGWRVDWITPGGGRQTTLLLTPGQAGR